MLLFVGLYHSAGLLRILVLLLLSDAGLGVRLRIRLRARVLVIGGSGPYHVGYPYALVSH